MNLLPHSLLTRPKNSTCFINTVYVENLGYSHATRGKLRQRQWEVITDLRSEHLGLLCARPVFRLSGQQFFKQNQLCLCIKSPFPHQKKRQLFPTDSLRSLGEQGNRKKNLCPPLTVSILHVPCSCLAVPRNPPLPRILAARNCSLVLAGAGVWLEAHHWERDLRKSLYPILRALTLRNKAIAFAAQRAGCPSCRWKGTAWIHFVATEKFVRI